ncbi:hypothetical protein CBM2633_A70296 [Cupriavidus taiwanensis]|uniref:Uncharacterized protein n=1 Tax=Cupriavidus taiwanensis TaxID=164546 RepID=A0A976AV66_9BURK|nr:hypothetical protein CBM2615_A240216 [Cupriavidus taiwanensis]SOZ54020.1 hypothetical protein CBM2614_A210218 [Cupriavidus taiwanensis]SOZ56495.1 hypothetical protein CBM2613_A220214 [Cupriavidus taiwanensis]SOZ97895.1 hypothetical protein CBM2626_A130241 [Cupriavidus taiwanensis]SPA04777.1 hypothetical protein CBM2625_A170214 [Cupriavidus taiwanensis]
MMPRRPGADGKSPGTTCSIDFPPLKAFFSTSAYLILSVDSVPSRIWDTVCRTRPTESLP